MLDEVTTMGRTPPAPPAPQDPPGEPRAAAPALTASATGSRVAAGVVDEAAALVAERQSLEAFALRRDARGFEALVECHRNDVFHLAQRILGDAAQAEEVAQESFLTLYQKANTLKADRSIRGWLLEVTRRHALKRRLGNRRRARREELYAMHRSDPNQPPENTEALRRALDALPAKTQMPLALHYLHGLAHAEVAQVLSIPLGTVASRISRGLKQLHKRLQTRPSDAAFGLAAIGPMESALRCLPIPSAPAHIGAISILEKMSVALPAANAGPAGSMKPAGKARVPRLRRLPGSTGASGGTMAAVAALVLLVVLGAAGWLLRPADVDPSTRGDTAAAQPVGAPAPAAAATTAPETGQIAATAAGVPLPPGWGLIAADRFGSGPDCNIRTHAELHAKYFEGQFYNRDAKGLVRIPNVVVNGERQTYVHFEQAVSFATDHLTIEGRGQADGSITSAEMVSRWRARSWCVEARYRVPATDKSWVGFWFYGSEKPGDNGELDFEQLSAANLTVHDVTLFNHPSATALTGLDPLFSTKGMVWRNPDFNANTSAHRYTLLYDDAHQRLVRYIDGQQIYAAEYRWNPSTPNDPGTDACVIINLAVGGNWPGNPTDPKAYLGDLDVYSIDYYGPLDDPRVPAGD